MLDDHTTRKARAAGGVLDIGDVGGFDLGQFHLALGQCVERFGLFDHAHLEALAGLLQEGQVTLRGDANDRIAGLQQSLELSHVGAVGADLDGGGQRDGNQARVLAGIEKANEFGVGLRDQRHAVTLAQAHAQQFAGQYPGLIAQVTIADAGIDSATARIEVRPGFAEGGVIQCLGQIFEIGRSELQAVGRRRRVRLQKNSPSIAAHITPTRKTTIPGLYLPLGKWMTRLFPPRGLCADIR